MFYNGDIVALNLVWVGKEVRKMTTLKLKSPEFERGLGSGLVLAILAGVFCLNFWATYWYVSKDPADGPLFWTILGLVTLVLGLLVGYPNADQKDEAFGMAIGWGLWFFVLITSAGVGLNKPMLGAAGLVGLIIAPAAFCLGTASAFLCRWIQGVIPRWQIRVRTVVGQALALIQTRAAYFWKRLKALL